MPLQGGATHSRSRIRVPRVGGTSRPVEVRRCLTRRPAGPATHADGCRGAVMTTAGVVGSERPGLKPRAESPSPLKGAVRRTGARGDRLGGGAVWISRLQPAWGLSPAVHGRASVERAARLIGAGCRAGRVGRVASPRHAARAGEAAPRPYKVGQPIPVRIHGQHGGAISPPCRGQAVPDPPAGEGRETIPLPFVRCAIPITACWCVPRVGRAHGAGGRGSASPLQPGGTFPVGRVSARAGATGPVL